MNAIIYDVGDVLCNVLIDGGSAFNILNKKNESALCLAAKNGRKALCEAIITNAVWGCPSKAEVDISRARIETFLLCLKRNKIHVSKDIKLKILLSHPELERDVVHVLYYDLCNGKEVDNWKDVLKCSVADYTIGELKLFMDCATQYVADNNVELKSILDSTVLETNFGKAIGININERLGHMASQAQEKIDKVKSDNKEIV